MTTDEPAPGPTESSIVPWPSSVVRRPGELTLTPSSRIVVIDRQLEPLAAVFAEEVRLVTGLDMEVETESRSADIVLRLDTALAEEEYGIEIDDVAVVRGGSCAGVALGSVTLLQMIATAGVGAVVPRATISDAPHSTYRGLMVDLARQWHTVETLKQIVVMCRLYKIRYLQLHLTDNQSFTFPSQSYPELATPGRHYTLSELRELERFASHRGVVLVPELDVPGHSNALVTARPDLFGISRWSDNPCVLNVGREGIYPALDRILGEIAEVFRASPYIHIGGDETRLTYLDEDPEAVAFMEQNQIAGVDELYRYFIVRVNEIVKRHGKQTIVWEGFRRDGEIEIPRDVVVMAWETAYQLPQDLLSAGYTIINASWKPLYVMRNRRWAAEDIYGWNMYRWENWYHPTPSFVPIQLEPNDKVIGGQMAAWEQDDIMEVPSLRHRLPALSERVWNPELGRDYSDFEQRLLSTDRLLQHLIRPAIVRIDGQSYPGYSGPFFNRENWFDDTATLSIEPLRQGYRVYYATDTTVQPVEWFLYSSPFDLAETTSLWMRVEDEAGEPVGFPWRTDYEFRPIAVTADGLAEQTLVDPAAEPIVFHDELTLTLRSGRPGGTIRFTLDGEAPSNDSPAYGDPIVLQETATLTAQLFDDGGTPLGEPIQRSFRRYRHEFARPSARKTLITRPGS